MEIIANPTGNYNGSASNGCGAAGNCGRSVPENFAASSSDRPLKHNIVLSTQWTRDEQSLLEELLIKYASDKPVMRYAKIAAKLQYKTMRDVASRYRWMIENGANQQVNSTPNAINSAYGLPCGQPYGQPSTSMDISEVGINYEAVGGALGPLLEQNDRALNLIRVNFFDFGVKVLENIHLLSQTKNNILTICNNIGDMSEIIKGMPPMREKLNFKLVNMCLPN